MITIFTIPKPFCGKAEIHQNNAIKSWTLLTHPSNIILFGNEKGADTLSRAWSLKHIPNVPTSNAGTPLLDFAFNSAQKIAITPYVAYLNADIILMSDFIEAVKSLKQKKFLLTGQRWNLEVNHLLSFHENWETDLKNRITQEGVLEGHSGLDYFVFPKNFPHNLPPFIVGRPAWDNWLLYHTKEQKITVVDGTQAITAVHQIHETSHVRIKKDTAKKKEAHINLLLSGGYRNLSTLWEADLLLTPHGLIAPPFPRNILIRLARPPLWRTLLGLKRKLQHLL